MASASSSETRYADEDIKSRNSKMREAEEEEEYTHDFEMHCKKDAPPRFSTLFETKSAPMPAPVLVEEPRRRRRSGGVFIPMPICVLLAIILALETMVIFAYTTIGLYNQIPGRMTMMGHSSIAAACDTYYAQPQQQLQQQQAQAQPAINFEPHIIVGGAAEQQAAVTHTITASDFEHLPVHTTSSSSTTTTTTTSTSSADPVVVTYTPPGGVLTSIVMVTPSVPSQERPTSFVTVVVGPSSSSSSEAAKSTISTSSSVSTSASTSTTSSTVSITTSVSTTSTSSETSTTAPATTTAPAKGNQKACIGGFAGPGGSANC